MLKNFCLLALALSYSFIAFSQISEEEIQKAKAAGLSDQQIMELVTKNQNQTEGEAATSTTNSSTGVRTAEAPLSGQLQPKTTAVESEIFGASLFSQSDLTFEPNLRLPTPKNYQLGAGDQLNISVYGASEANYERTVSPEGSIQIPLVGIINVNGMSVEQASKIIKSRLSTVYGTINTGESSVNITLGNIRSIQVMVIGEAARPGSYTVPSLATVFNALYQSGGPSANGSMRNIKLLRDGKLIATVDLYDFLVNGELKNNAGLQDQDVIKIEPYDMRVRLSGEVKHPGIFEAKPGETLADMIKYSGGFTDDAFRNKVTVFRATEQQRSVSSVSAGQMQAFALQAGDQFMVERLLNRFENRVQITGGVYRPGTYDINSTPTLKSLIEKSYGLIEEAYMPRGVIFRKNEAREPQVVAFNVQDVVSGVAADIPLVREDSIHIATIFEMRENKDVSIWGAVQNPGHYPYEINLTIRDLVFQAQGFLKSAEIRSVEVYRKITDPDSLQMDARKANIFHFALDNDLAFQKNEGDFLLQEDDQVVVRPMSGYESLKRVRIEGEFVYPGEYILVSKNERVSDVISRAGGLTSYAYPEGAFLLRMVKKTNAEKKKEMEMLAALQNIDDEEVTLPEFEANMRQEMVGISLEKIMANKGSKWDLILEDGDVLSLPKELQTVKVSGAVLFPVNVRFNQQNSFKNYVSEAGGFSDRAIKRKSYVVYPNGMAKSTKKFLFVNNYPEVKPGSQIIIPEKEIRERRQISVTEIISVSTGVASVAAIIVALFK